MLLWHKVAFKNNKKRAYLDKPLKLESGSDLSSRAVASQVLSARGSLTSVFGMGTGVASQPLPPEILNIVSCKYPHNCIGTLLQKYSKSFCFDQALGLLVPVSCMHCCTSTPGLSTL